MVKIKIVKWDERSSRMQRNGSTGVQKGAVHVENHGGDHGITAVVHGGVRDQIVNVITKRD